MSAEELPSLLAAVPTWQLNPEGSAIHREFVAKNFRAGGWGLGVGGGEGAGGGAFSFLGAIFALTWATVESLKMYCFVRLT